jgi:hypothetical protein
MSKQLVLALAERLFICSQLLGCAAERLAWDSEKVQELIEKLERQVHDAVLPR